MAPSPGGQGFPGAGVSRTGFISHHFAPNARQDGDEGDQCSQKDGDDDGQGGIHREGRLGASIEGECVSQSSHFGGVMMGRRMLYNNSRCLLSALHVPGTLLGAGDTAGKNPDQAPPLWSAPDFSAPQPSLSVVVTCERMRVLAISLLHPMLTFLNPRSPKSVPLPPLRVLCFLWDCLKKYSSLLSPSGLQHKQTHHRT